MSLRVPIQESAATHRGLRRLAVPRALLRSGVIAVLRDQGIREAEISMTLLSDPEMAELNRQYLHHDGPTDVISFPLFEPPEPVLGDVYLGIERAEAEARARGMPAAHELLRLAVHGTLHVLGYDHPAGAGRTRSRMWRLQERILDEVLES